MTLSPIVETHAVEQHHTTATTVVELLRMAMDKGMPVEALEKLQALHERVSNRQAAQEFNQALATFQKTCPPIAKNKSANIAGRNGGGHTITYADLPEIILTIGPHLETVGLSYTWDCTAEKGMLTTTCILRHVSGHREQASFVCPVESGAGMSEQQKYASALSFGRRMSLISVLGLSTTEAERIPVDPTPISEDEALALEDACDEHKINKARLLKLLKVERFTEVPAVRLQDAYIAIEDTILRREAK